MDLGDGIVRMRGMGAATTWIPLDNKAVLSMFEVPVNVFMPVGQFIFGMVKNLAKWHGLDTIILDIIISIALLF